MSFTKPRIFRATLESWLGQLMLPLVFFYVLTFTAVQHMGLNPLIGGVGLGVLALVALLDYILPMLRNWLQVDDCTLDGSMNGRNFRIYWNEVLAAWVAVLRGKRFLCLGTKDGTVVLPLRFFNDRVLWKAVQERVPAEALQKKAILRLPDYQKWAETKTGSQGTDNESALACGACPVADHWLIQLGGWSCMTYCLFGLARAVQAGQTVMALVFLGLMALAFTVLRKWGITEIDGRGVRRSTLFGGWHIAWEDVREIEMDPWNLVVVLIANGRLRIIPGPWLWNGLKKKIALDLILDQASSRQIPLRRSMGIWSRILGWKRLAR